MWNMDPYMYALVIHARRSVCKCGHAFTLKREARITASSPLECKRALESMKIHCGDKKKIVHVSQA